jgi:hypothetical protein
LDFDGVAGPLQLEVRSLARLLAVFRVDDAPGLRLEAAGKFQHGGQSWRLDGVGGVAAGNRFGGSIGLDEGGSGQADRLHLDLDFPALDLRSVLANANAASPAKTPTEARSTGTLSGQSRPDIIIDGNAHAAKLNWQQHRLDDVAVHFLPGGSDSQGVKASFGVLIGRGEMEAEFRTGDRPSALTVAMRVAGADVGAVANTLGLGPRAMTGRLHAQASGTIHGAALSGATAQAAVWVEHGAVSRELLEKASSDLLALFKDKHEKVPITCFIALADLQAGILYLPKMRLRAGNVQVDGRGLADLHQHRIDLVLQPRGGGALALDRPFAVRGSLAAPSIAPSPGRTVPLPALPTPPRWVAGNPCNQ